MLSDQERDFIAYTAREIESWAFDRQRPLDCRLRGSIRELMAIIDREITNPSQNTPPTITVSNYHLPGAILNRVNFPELVK
jgi:hypothetical protein